MARNFRRRLALLSLALVTPGCELPLRHTMAGSYETIGEEREVTTRSGVLWQILLYLPNRVVDLLDIIKVGVAVSLPAGVDIRITKWGQLALQAGAGVGVQWDGRSNSPWVYDASATAAFGPFRTGAGAGEVPTIGDWEIGYAGPGGKVAIDLSELLDFALGWFFIDIKKDDYGWE